MAARMATVPAPLDGDSADSFGEFNVRRRLPELLAKVAAAASRCRREALAEHDTDAAAALEHVVDKLTLLRDDMRSDKVLDEGMRFNMADDVGLWQALLQHNIATLGEGGATWRGSPTLLVESYISRKMVDAFYQHERSRVDVLHADKQAAFDHWAAAMNGVASHLMRIVQELEGDDARAGPPPDCSADLKKYLLLALFCGTCDVTDTAFTNAFGASERHKPNVLNLASLQQIASRLSARSSKDKIHMVLGGGGLELFADLCLAELLLSARRCTAVVFHVKCAPFFVSGTRSFDVSNIVARLIGRADSPLVALGQQWQRRLANGTFSVRADRFWTLPHSFDDMKSVAPELYEELAQAKLTIFKGDLNYCKLVGDLNWPVGTAYPTALRGFDLPHCALRTLKSPVCVGITEAEAERRRSAHGGTYPWSWAASGSYSMLHLL